MSNALSHRVEFDVLKRDLVKLDRRGKSINQVNFTQACTKVQVVTEV